MRNPLRRRVFREIRGELGKYTVIFLFMIMVISATSGYFIADASLKQAYDDSFAVYNIEDGYIETPAELTDEQKQAIEEESVTLYNRFYKDVPSVNDSKLRVFRIREEVNKISLLDGKLPAADSEIALDRLYMQSNHIKQGETITLEDKDYTIVGTVALPDYSALYDNVTDFMFDTEKFGVGTVTDTGFDRMPDTHLHYSYSWKYDNPPAEVLSREAIDRSEDFLKAIAPKVMLTNFVPTCRNSAVTFAGDDLGHDRVLFMVMLYMLIVIIAFVFAVTTGNTIAKEANVIGTLRASGYTKGELIRHYMAAPVLVLLIASLIGNVLGYTVFKEIMADMYLGSYSLVSYEVLWNADAFIDTTVIPLLILSAINFIMLASKLSLSPLKFLRRDLKRRQRKKAFKLNTKIPIMTRYRLRVLFQNIPGYVTIFAGIFFASVIMIFSLLFDPLLDNLDKQTQENMLAAHQVIVKMPVETETKDAEKFGVQSLKIVNGDFSESVSVYGIAENSRYFHADFTDGNVLVSSAYADKYGLSSGDSVTLHEEYGSKTYDFRISGIYEYPSTLAVFMQLDALNDTFDLDEGSFTGYFSDSGISDLPEEAVASDITKDDLTKTSRQLRRSMGNMMGIFLGVGASVMVLVVFLLSKVMIEKNTQSISVTKILGYSSGEISGVYIRTTTIVTLCSVLLCLPLVGIALDAIWRAMMMEYAGWLAPVIPVSAYVKTVLLAAETYVLTALLLKHRISRVPMDEALKNQE